MGKNHLQSQIVRCLRNLCKRSLKARFLAARLRIPNPGIHVRGTVFLLPWHCGVGSTRRIKGAHIRLLQRRLVGLHDGVRRDQDRGPVAERRVAVVKAVDEGEDE